MKSEMHILHFYLVEQSYESDYYFQLCWFSACDNLNAWYLIWKFPLLFTTPIDMVNVHQFANSLIRKYSKFE